MEKASAEAVKRFAVDSPEIKKKFADLGIGVIKSRKLPGVAS
jgi:hypothetical protein